MKMPAAYIGFVLKPSGLFDPNPSNDLPPSPRKGAALPAAGEAKGCCH
jgi:primary-amine oxidase